VPVQGLAGNAQFRGIVSLTLVLGHPIAAINKGFPTGAAIAIFGLNHKSGNHICYVVYCFRRIVRDKSGQLMTFLFELRACDYLTPRPRVKLGHSPSRWNSHTSDVRSVSAIFIGRGKSTKEVLPLL